MVKRYYKETDSEGVVTLVGYGYGENEITKEEYEELKAEILARAEAEAIEQIDADNGI